MPATAAARLKEIRDFALEALATVQSYVRP